jgi:RHS repeat-associated protein
MRKQRTIERVIAGFGRALRWLGLTILPVMVVTLSGSSRALGYAPVCDALGRLAERRTSGDTVTTNRMDYAGWQLIAEYNQAGTFVRKYVYGDGLDEPVRMAGGTKRYYYHPDALGSVATITTNNGLKAESYTYDAYGTPTIYSGAGTIITSSLMTNRLLFTSRDYNATTTLYHYRYRYYSPTVGRFLQPDPIHLAGGDLNLYRYVYNNPVNASDPFGLADTWGGAVADWVDNSVNSTLGRVNTKWVEVNLPIALVENGLKGFGDLLRFGDGLANAFYNTDSDWLDRLTVASADFGRAGGIILIATPFLCKGAPAAPTSPKLLGATRGQVLAVSI